MARSTRGSVRLGVVGLGKMGVQHARWIEGGEAGRLRLAAVSHADPRRRAEFPGATGFSTPEAMMASGEIDAVLIATPHYSHTSLGIAALEAGLHVLVEKPISAHKADAERLVTAHRGKGQVFAAMFQQRTDPYHLKIRSLIRSGRLGAVRRVQWTITDWFRPEAYYRSNAWRGTWKGEGGGVLLNQCPHNLDLMLWWFGRPDRVRAVCRLGRYHDIEVEDDVTAFLEYPGGAHATFIASTGEAPGTNRLEIAADRGRVVYEGGRIVFTQNTVTAPDFSRRTQELFSAPKTREWVYTFPDRGPQHRGILKNFADAILDGKPLIAPADEGLGSVELANAMLLSSDEGRTIDLPLDGKRYERALKRWAAPGR